MAALNLTFTVYHRLIERACDRLGSLYDDNSYKFEFLQETNDAKKRRLEYDTDEATGSKSSKVPSLAPSPTNSGSSLNELSAAVVSALTEGEVRGWGVARVLELLNELSLSALADAFHQNVVDGNTFFDLTFEDLKDDLEIKDDHAISTILNVIDAIKSS